MSALSVLSTVSTSLPTSLLISVTTCFIRRVFRQCFDAARRAGRCGRGLARLHESFAHIHVGTTQPDLDGIELRPQTAAHQIEPILFGIGEEQMRHSRSRHRRTRFQQNRLDSRDCG